MKPRLLLVGPVLTASGYGTHARQILRALLAGDRFDVHVEPIRWGETAYILDDSVAWVRDVASKGIPGNPDVCIEVTIPNEFKRRAPLTIGVTAGIEVDRVAPEWIDRCNREVDVVVVPSRHSAGAFSIEFKHGNGQTLSLQKPLAILPEGVDTSVYRPAAERSPLLDRLEVPGRCLISTGLGLDKPDGRDRKNITKLVEWFCRAFKGRADVGLVLKTSIVNGSNVDFEITKKRIADIKRSATAGADLPRVFLLHGRLSEAELAAVYNDERIAAMVSLTHGEGFGLPLIEAAACDLPVIATDWSGHLDFLSKEGKKLFVPVAFDLGEIPQECVWPGVMDQGTHWANPREADAVDKMRRMFASSVTPKKWARELGLHIRERYSLEATGKILEETVWDAWRQVQSRALVSREDAVAAMRETVRAKGKSLVYTMPMSAGDVFLSLAVVHELRIKHPGHRVYFATLPQYYDIVKGHPDVDETVEWLPWMQEIAVLEDVFDEVYTPNLAVQMTWSNWIHRGKGRHLLDEFAAQCGVGEFSLDPPMMAAPPGLDELVPKREGEWVAVHAGGQKSARGYAHWTELVKNIRAAGLKVVQVGASDDIPVGEVDDDARGKFKLNELPAVLRDCGALVCIDSFPMHVANSMDIPIVALFGSSYPGSTGPQDYPRDVKLPIILETRDRHGCDRACYKDVCKVDASNPCINEISPRDVYAALGQALGKHEGYGVNTPREMPPYVAWVPKIGGYTHILDPRKHGYPFLQSIGSMLPFCQEIVVVDGGSTDGSLEEFRERFSEELTAGRIRIESRAWDPEEPGMDGMQKAFGRALCSPEMEFLWQQDADEVVHPEDAQRVLDICKRFPTDVDVVHLPVVELWGDDRTCRTDRHSWKWRLTRNNFRVTHGINIHARQMDPKTGRFFAKRGMSDGCELIDIVTGEHLPHRGFYNQELDELRQRDPAAYGKRMNQLFKQLPSVWHYSWADLPRKIKNFRDFWDGQWNVLYQSAGEVRFPDVKTDEDIVRKAAELRERGGEHGQAKTFPLERTPPPSMEGWVTK